MQGWSTTIRTGNPETDLRTVDQHRQQARAQGLELHVQPLPTGGYHVQASPPGGGAGAQQAPPDPLAAYGGTMPSAPNPNRPPAPAAAMPMPNPQPQASDPLAQFGGTMPSTAGYAAQIRPAPQVIMHPSAQYGGMGACQVCGREGPTKQVTLMQNIGVLVIRFPKTLSGHLCKFCIDHNFFKMSIITALFGWWGVISFFYTLVSLPVNFVARMKSIGMESPREDGESIAEKRTRGLVLILVGCAIGLFSTLFILATLAGSEDIVDAAIGLGVTFIVLDVPAALLLFAGIRDRMRASRAAQALGLI